VLLPLPALIVLELLRAHRNEQAKGLGWSVGDNLGPQPQHMRLCRRSREDGPQPCTESGIKWGPPPAATLIRTGPAAGYITYAFLAYVSIPVKSTWTQGSSPTTQASCPGGITTTSPGPTSFSVPSSIRTTMRPETQ
jgi:hypothetical protein